VDRFGNWARPVNERDKPRRQYEVCQGRSARNSNFYALFS
jgi:hypothetical protein